MKLNKAAMFGFCRALKKQSGGLFLASRYSVDSEETRGSFKATRGAMFGLDARIALAIFGALSVISGAALYSAIQKARATAFIVEVNELGKAIEAYMLDTGQDIPTTSLNNYSANQLELVKSSVAGWKGPYFDNGRFKVVSPEEYSRFFSSVFDGSNISIDIVDIAKDPTSSNVDCTASSKGCYYWIRFQRLSKKDADYIDKIIDGAVSASTGNARTAYNSITKLYDVSIKSARTLK